MMSPAHTQHNDQTPPWQLLLVYRALVVAGCCAFAMSTLFSSVKPVLLSRFVEQADYSQTLAGLLVALPFVGIAGSAFLVNRLQSYLTIRGATAVLGLLLVAAQLINGAVYSAPGVVVICQFVSGLCVGLLMGYCSQIISTTRVASLAFGVVDMIAVLLMSVMITGVSYAIAHTGLSGGFFFSAGVLALFTVLMLAAVSRVPVASSVTGRVAKPLELRARPILLLIMGVLFITSSGLGFAFMFTKAQGVGLNYQQAGRYVGLILFFSALACLAGGYCAAKFGAAKTLICAFAVCALSWVLALSSQTSGLFLAALIPAIFSLQFNFPVLLSLYGELDGSGRWAAIGTPLLTSGFAWAAIAAGIIVDALGLMALAWFNLVAMVVCTLILIGVEAVGKPMGRFGHQTP